MDKNISYEEMSKDCKVYEESEVPYYHKHPMINEYEMKKPESKGYNQSGMK